jgi:hypothetical protein
VLWTVDVTVNGTKATLVGIVLVEVTVSVKLVVVVVRVEVTYWVL